MMWINTFILIVLVGTQIGSMSFASFQKVKSLHYASFGVEPHPPRVLNCNLRTPLAHPSAAMLKITQGQGNVYSCTKKSSSEDASIASSSYEIALIAANIDTATAKENGSNLNFVLSCTGDEAAGIYLFGGYPVGFKTSSADQSPWFYNTQVSGRCLVKMDQALTQKFKPVTNQSAMVILPKMLAPAVASI